MSTFTTKTTSWFLLFFIISISSALPGLSQTITGTVFRDYNSDGVYTSAPVSGTYNYGEPGVGGVIVKAFNASGVVSASAISSTLTASLGSYTLTVGNNNAYRVEFTNLSTGDYDGFRGTNSATSVQFVNGGATSVNFGVNYPSDYCQSNPQIVVPCYVNGNSTGTGSGTTVSANRDVLVQLPYNSTGDSPAESSLGLNNEIGTVFGVAYQRQGKHLFTSAFLKRHSGLGPGGPGAIYLSDLAGNHSLFTTLPTAATAVTAAGSTTVLSNTGRGLPNSAGSANHDPSIFDQVGKAGLGDLEVSDDGTELYVVNLGDRKLYRIPINNPTSLTPTAGTPTTYTIPTPTQTTGSQFRPFGLKYYRDKVYVGGVTTNEAVSTTISFGTGSTSNTPLRTRDTTGMKAVVYEFNPVNGSFTTVLSFPLTYKKGASDNDQTGSSRAEYWFPWVDTQAPNSFLSRYARNDLANASHPQPMLTDIEIDVDGSMIIALRDRFGEQYGNQNYGTNTADNSTLYRAIAPGDLLRAGKCNPTTNLWTIERNASICSGTATAGASTTQGIGGGEFYYGDAISQPNATNPYHAEMVLGGLALLPGYGEVLSTAMDPTTNTDAGGIRRFKNNGFGAPSTSAQIYYSGNDVATYGKGNGLGDVEVVCNPAPVQIGNRVWLDSNNNGIQDPGEPPLAGVKVTLSGQGLASPVSVTTTATGEYYFSNSTSGTTTTGYSYSLTNLTSGGSYTLTFPTSVSTASLSSKPNSATGSNPDYIDTDPNTSGIVSFTLGKAGVNDFTFDAGFVPCSFTATAQANGNLGSTTVCQGTSATLTAQVSPTDSYTYAWSTPTGITLTNGTTATATTSGLPTGTHTFTLTVSSSPVCSTTATVSVVVNALPTPTFTSATICVGQSVTLTATGGTSYTFSNGTTNTTGLLVVSPTSTTAYSVTVANASGCKSTTTATVTVNQLPTPALTSATICVGQSVTLTATGGTSYTFSNGTTNTTGLLVVSPTSTTAYSVTVANASGCISTTSATATVNTLPTPALSSATICAGQSATLTATGGTSYTFSNGTTNTTGLLVVSPVSTTAYSVTVANASGCKSTTTATVTVNTLPNPTLTSGTICAGQSVTLTATGGTSYTFSNGTINTTGLLVVSPTSTTAYSVTVANASGCISTTTSTVNVNQLPAATLSSATICVGSSVTLTASGGTSYTFSNGTTNTTGLLVVSPSSTTAYSVTVANGAGCQATATGGVTVNSNPIATLSSATICEGQSVTLTATGGNSYSFSNGTTNTTGLLVVSPTSTTAYSVTASGGTNCSASASGTVTVNSLPTPALTSATICVGQSATLTATGGTSYSFSNGTTNTTGLLVVSPTSTTAYSVTVANASGCLSITTATVNVNSLPIATLSSATICVGSSVTLTATGGTNYTFSNGTTNTTGLLIVSPSSTTAYSVTVTSSAGCQALATGGVTVNNNPVATLSSATICVGQSVTLTATGGNSYTFSNGTTNTTGLLVVSPASTTAYSVTASGGANCSASATGGVVVNSLPTPTFTSATICAGQSVTLTATGGTSYTFSNGTTNTTGLLVVSPTSTTAYSVTVANASGCKSTTTATVTVNQLPTPTLSSATICVGQSVTLTASGGTSYSFSTGTTNTTGLLVVSPTSTTAYSVTVANASGCKSTTTATVTVNALPTPAMTSATICVGQSVTLTATGGTSYSFSTGTTNTTGLLVVSPTSTTAYSVTVANASGCISTTTTTVNVNSLPTPTLTSATMCAGQSVTLTATGGTSYTFSNGTTNTTGLLVVSPTSTTAYSVTVANASGCKSTTSATVTVNQLPAAALSSATICAGSSATLTASGGTSYTFSNGITNTTGLLIVSPSSTTAYSVTVVSSAGCQATATGGVMVNNNPVATLSSATICEGQSATLIASGGSSFTFSDGTVNTTGLLVVSPASTTAYSVTASGGANCSASASGEVTVNPLPTLQTSVSCNGLATYDVSFTATAGASVSASIGSVTGSVISGIPSGQTVTITVTLDGCSITQQLTQNCSSNAASLGDFVWLDSDKDGIQDTGEPGIEGVTAILYVNGVASATTVTDATGFYSFTGLTPGNSTSYVVGFTAPAGYTATIPYSGTDRTVDSNADLTTGKTESVTLAPGEFNPTLDAGFYIPSAGLGDFVWLDSDKDGIQDTGEPGIEGVTAILYVNGVASATTVTDATGFYSFTGLTPGNSTSYVVGFTAPAGYTATIPYSGTDRTVDSNVDLITGKTESVTLAPGEFNPTLDAGFFIPSAGLGDFVWLDSDKDGIQDTGEPGIAGVTAILYVNGVASATTVTDATGFYSFTGLTPGNSTSYVVGFTAPSGYTATTPYSGTDRTVDSNADLITGKTESVTLAPGEFNPTLDAGFFIPSAGLGDFVWIDLDKDGIQDDIEPGIEGVAVVLYINGAASATTVTNASGFYSFTGLTPGSSLSYSVGFTTPSGYTATTPLSGADRALDSDADLVTGLTSSVTLAPGEFNPTLDAGYLVPAAPSTIASLGDFVWLDSNKDGIQDTGEPGITGVTAVLYVNGVASTTTVTDATGFYSFTGLTPGNSTSYVVGFTAPTGYTATTPYSGTDRTVDSNADLITGKTESVTLAPGEFNPTLDAGFYVLPTILTLDKVVDKSKAQLGDILSYTIVLTNVGSTTATNVTVRDSTTTGLTYIANSASAPTGTTFTQGYPISLWSVASISPGQSLSLTFQAKADSSGILYNTATIPGDTAKVCTSIPVHMCAGDDYAFELTAPVGRSNYKWFKDGVEIIGATTNVLSVTAAGTYSLVVDGSTGQCPDFSCCPFIIEEDTLPNYKAVAVPVSCVGNTPQTNGQIVLSGFGSGLTYQYSLGASFNAAASLSGAAQAIPTNGVIATNLVNPATAQSYTIRVYTASGCYKDVTVLLMPTVCGCPADICVPYVISQTKRPQRIGDPR